MRHRGTKKGRPRDLIGYAWYDPVTGRIDRRQLAADATRGADSVVFECVPAWLDDVPEILEGATPIDLARIDALARRRYLERPG